MESQTRSSRRLFRENPLSGFHQQLFHQYASYQKKRGKRFGARPIRKMLEAIDAGYSLILFPEGTRGKPEQMGKIKSGIARILSLRPEVKYIPVFMTGMGRSLPKGKMILLPYKASIYYGMPALVKSTDTHEILEQITGDFERMKEKYQVVIDEEEE
ncbi:lysophospholipid acyltransferase family protein [Bacteroides xylanisolvens]|uniref:lysophospholipid acyltransferase family protein n=1 Tax=Bacteroides xylanisolvens TaxID=371601 RepID=UPI001AD8191A|nr:lysophospholipid acyltransferase family protein [Bacteroides xylanisolvens]